MEKECVAQLLGTELEIVADFDLTPLLEALRGDVEIIRNSVDDGRHTLWLELTAATSGVDDAVGQYVVLIEALPAHLRVLWDTSADRCLNTGVQSGLRPHAFPVCLAVDS